MKETITSLQRIRTVMEGGIPDRVPVCLLSFQNAAHLAGYSVSEYCLDGTKMARAQLAYWDEFRHDMIEIENGIAALAEAVGCEVAYPEGEPPWVIKPAIESLDDLHKLPDDPIDSAGVRELVKATALIAAELGERVCIRGDADQGAFSLAAQIVGAENFLMALTDPENETQIHRLLAYANQQVMNLARAQAAAGSHYTIIGDSIAGPDVCSPLIYRKFALPYEKRLIEQLRREGIEVGLHICGDTTRIIEDMLATGALYFELDYKSDREVIRRATQGKATIIGTLDPSGLMLQGSPDEITAKALEDIATLGQRGRFILGAGCTLPRDTPPENVHALVGAARQGSWQGDDGISLRGEG